MRTSKKGGIGHFGWGQRPESAPALAGVGPVSRYRQPARPQRSFSGRILRGFGWLALALAVVGSGVAGGLYLYIHKSLGALEVHSKAGRNAISALSSKVPDASQPAIALVAGYDVRAGTGANGYAGSNSDTLMLIRADPVTHSVSLLSFPRDLAVNIYCHGNTVSTQDRINSAWVVCGNNGGPYAAVDTMKHLTGLNINYLITLDFHAFKQLVNRLHGVYMNVDRHYYNPPHNGSGYSAINLQPGYQKLDGGQALSYVRYRHTDSDIYRTGRQQLFLAALKERAHSVLSNPLEIPQLIGALKQNMEIGRGGGGAVSIKELETYAGLFAHLPAGRLFRSRSHPTTSRNSSPRREPMS